MVLCKLFFERRIIHPSPMSGLLPLVRFHTNPLFSIQVSSARWRLDSSPLMGGGVIAKWEAQTSSARNKKPVKRLVAGVWMFTRLWLSKLCHAKNQSHDFFL